MAVDISAELETINEDPYGANVKDAIYTALLKLAQSEGGGSGTIIGPAWRVLLGFNTSIHGCIQTEEE